MSFYYLGKFYVIQYWLLHRCISIEIRVNGSSYRSLANTTLDMSIFYDQRAKKPHHHCLSVVTFNCTLHNAACKWASKGCNVWFVVVYLRGKHVSLVALVGNKNRLSLPSRATTQNTMKKCKYVAWAVANIYHLVSLNNWWWTIFCFCPSLHYLKCQTALLVCLDIAAQNRHTKNTYPSS